MDDEHSLGTDIILNPILPGFHPDPSILRVDNDFYIATSTFEWFPGVRISHSRDLRNWRVLTHALTRLFGPRALLFPRAFFTLYIPM